MSDHAEDCASHVFRPFPCSCGLEPADDAREERLREALREIEIAALNLANGNKASAARAIAVIASEALTDE